jgi:hypothetical protein
MASTCRRFALWLPDLTSDVALRSVGGEASSRFVKPGATNGEEARGDNQPPGWQSTDSREARAGERAALTRAWPTTSSGSGHPDGSHCDVSGGNRAPTSTATLSSKSGRPTAKLGYDVDGDRGRGDGTRQGRKAKASRVDDDFRGQAHASDRRQVA